MTYSMLVFDSDSGAIGLASQSHFFGVGAVVGRSEAGVGAVVSQAFANTDWSHFGLDMLQRGRSPESIVDELVDTDPLSDYRQLMVMDHTGTCSAYTGSRCARFARASTKDGVGVAGNMLASEDLVAAVLERLTSESTLPLADRLVAGMRCAEARGGDVRGSESAWMRGVTGHRSSTPWREVLFDIRVDDHDDPVTELERLRTIHRGFTVIGRALFSPPLVIGSRDEIDAELALAMASELSEASKLLGANREAAFWRGVVLLRAGFAHEGWNVLDAVVAERPAMTSFIEGLIDIDMIPRRNDS